MAWPLSYESRSSELTLFNINLCGSYFTTERLVQAWFKNWCNLPYCWPSKSNDFDLVTLWPSQFSTLPCVPAIKAKVNQCLNLNQNQTMLYLVSKRGDTIWTCSTHDNQKTNLIWNLKYQKTCVFIEWFLFDITTDALHC